ncbi:MAG: matrixin family metalloprotease [Luteitalea sp.]|nr:matrixin family metalloprotease [Luteitalea sp.]
MTVYGERSIAARRRIAVLLTVLLVLLPAHPALAYLKFGFEIGSRSVTARWLRFPVRYFVTNRGVPGVSATDLQGAAARAFATWQGVPTAAITYDFAGFTSNQPGEDDGRTTLGFQSVPELDRVLASTSFLIDGLTGELLEADIFFNSAFAWSVAAGGERNRWDLETIAVHEIGHLSGLGHSAIGETEVGASGRRVLAAEAVMFPIALGTNDVSGRLLRPDDVAGISDLYPDGGFNDDTGSVSGRITKSGAGVFGAHIVAFDIAKGELVGNFSLRADGQFSIAGLRPGPHAIRVEPIDDADTDSFFDNVDPVDLNFRSKYYEQLVIVPRGADSGAIEVEVAGK